MNSVKGKWGSGLVGSFPAIFFLTVFQAKNVHSSPKNGVTGIYLFLEHFFNFLRIGYQVLGQLYI